MALQFMNMDDRVMKANMVEGAEEDTKGRISMWRMGRGAFEDGRINSVSIDYNHNF